MRNRTWQFAFVIGLGVALAGFLNHAARSQVAAPATRQPANYDVVRMVTKAVAVVHPLGDSKVKGTVTFTQQDGGVEVVAELTGLATGEHGFHIHEFGDCSMADGVCAGAHFNPAGAPHAGPDDAKRHVGDLGNIKADESGRAMYKRVDKLLALNGPNSIIGRSVIVHAGRDDLTTQPSGDAGARVGCGAVGIADPKMQH